MWGCKLRFEYPSCKLLDFDAELLERDDNPASIVIAAHRAAQSHAGDPLGNLAINWQLTRRLHERGYRKRDILELFRLIDWLIRLPPELAIEFRRQLIEYEDQKDMPYITSIEEFGRQEGRQEGIILARQKAVCDALEVRFGHIPKGIRRAIEAIEDEASLRSLHKSAIQTDSIANFNQCLGLEARQES